MAARPKHLPLRRVKIGNLTYKIRWSRGHIGRERHVGLCDYDNQVISIWSGLPLEGQRDTAMHEILHAVGSFLRVKYTDEEEVVEKFASGICMLFHNNPGLKEVLFPEEEK